MNYIVSYGMSCNMGNVRKYNQDNFWCDGRYLEEINRGIGEIYCGALAANENPVFAVFDGMGGEQKGEAASYIAATMLDRVMKENDKPKDEAFFSGLFRQINAEVCEYGNSIGIHNIGSTGALLGFSRNKVTVCNIGDSPILRLNNGTLTQISVDHVLATDRKKSPLTQFLGVPLDEFIIEPHTAQIPVCDKDRYLICSDGVTDMISREEIAKIMTEVKDIGECTHKLLSTALNNGGVDNTTLIVLEIKKLKLFGKIDI
ncbi:MAG: serine/threonine-protein phosphatase [Ruminococcaceae bacterium]|nr:serine/threonine-protein phosphatase [Oscillospiraceae bacterium]